MKHVERGINWRLSGNNAGVLARTYYHSFIHSFSHSKLKEGKKKNRSCLKYFMKGNLSGQKENLDAVACHCQSGITATELSKQ